MNKFVIMLFSLVLLVGCDKRDEQLHVTIPTVSNIKIIGAKQDTIESRYNITSHLLGGSSHKATTVHYIVATDGTVCEVDVGPYALAKVGDKYDCISGWNSGN